MATITSATSGLWSAGATWVGGTAPVNGDKVYIANTHTVTVAGDCAGGDDTVTAVNINSGGTLKFSRTANSSLTLNGELLILTGGTLDIGKSADPIPAGITADIIVNRSATLADGKWGITTQNRSYIWFYGAAKQTNTILAGDIAIGATTARVENATGWRVGDTVCLGATSPTATFSSQEIVVVTGVTLVSGTIYDITWTGGITYPHTANAPVGNFSNNITLQPYNATYRSYFTIIWGTDQYLNSIELRYISFRNMTTGTPGSYNEYGALTLIGPNKSNNYPIFISIGNLAFYQDWALSGQAQFVGSAFKNRIEVTDCAFYNPSQSVYAYAGYVADFKRCYFYKSSVAVSYGYSEGARNARWYDCYFTGASNQAENIIGGIQPEHYNCYFFSNNFAIAAQVCNGVLYNNCYFSRGGKTPVGATILAPYMVTSSFGSLGNILFTDCFFEDNKLLVYDTVTTSFLDAMPSLKLVLANKNQDPSKQEIYTPAGYFKRDNTVFKTGVASLLAELKSATTPLTLDMNIFAPTGKPVQVSGYLRKNDAYGSSTLPSVTLSGLGITPSTFTMSNVNDEWVQFIVAGTQNSGTDGILTLTANFQAGAGSAWIDGISAPPAAAVNTGDFGYWADGQPAKLIASNYTSALDIWNTLKTNVSLTGSMGKEVKNIKGDTGALL